MPKFLLISHRGAIFKPLEFIVKTPVTGQTGPVNRSVYRSEPIARALLNSDLNSTGFRSNRSGKPLPEAGGLTGPVGKINPGVTGAPRKGNAPSGRIPGARSAAPASRDAVGD